MALKIYGLAMSTCTTRVLTTCVEKCAEFELVTVNLSAGEHKKPEFLALQPFGVIPVMKDGDFKLFESRAIARYIATKNEGKGTALYGKTLHEKALVEQWLEVESQNYSPPMSAVVGQLVFAKFKGMTTDEAVVKANYEKLEKVLDIYEEHLSKNEYLAGNFFSLADLSHLPYTHYLINVAKRGEAITCRKHVNAWWEKISSRPSWKQVLELSSKKE